MNRLKYFWYFSLLMLWLISSCSLNSDQEKALNNAMTKYVKAHNDEQLMTYIAYTHPNAVSFYLEKGDSAFKNRYTLVDDVGIVPFLQDGIIKEVEKSEGMIQVRYQFLKVYDDLFEVQGDEVHIFALSEDDGKTWFFIDAVDYYNDAVINPENRLIKKND